MTFLPAHSTAAESRAVSLLSRVILPASGRTAGRPQALHRGVDTNARRAHAPTRTTLEIGAESEVSFATYFNAFPASYWRRWSTLESVVLRVELTGSGRVDLYRSKATGARITVDGREIAECRRRSRPWTEFEIGLEPFEDGGWIWFDITTDTDGHRAQRGLVRAGASAGQGQHRGRHPDLQPARRLCQRAGARSPRTRWWTR